MDADSAIGENRRGLPTVTEKNYKGEMGNEKC